MESDLISVDLEIVFNYIIDDILAVFAYTFRDVHKSYIFASRVFLESDEALLGFFQSRFKLNIFSMKLT